MPALIKLPPKFKYIGLPNPLPVGVSPTPDNMGARVTAVATVNGEPVTDVKMNQLVKMVPSVSINTSKYQALVSYNPMLAELGAVSCPSITGEGSEIMLTVKAYKNFSLLDLDYIFQLYVID